MHPGQTDVSPLYCTVPLEEYEHLKKIEKLYNEMNLISEEQNIECRR